MTSSTRFKTVGVLAITAALGVLQGAIARAHDGHEHEAADSPQLTRTARDWTHASGRLQVRGSFVAAHGDQVQIRQADGRLIDMRLQALSAADRAWVDERRSVITRLNTELALLQKTPRPAGADAGAGAAPAMWKHFQPFADTLKLRWDDDYFYVESNGIPAHPMMIGITAWQQQVPLPQAYTGDNAWRIPLHPVPAARPMSAKENFFRGAIALAVNGIPIFNPIKNDGRTDTFLAGELDEYGGHCGRADDYHYHIAPVHLQPKLAKGDPVAYALDGYPIFGETEADGSKALKLDVFNGHADAKGAYHYHATKTYPYLNGGFHGEVVERGGQVDPQPRAEPVRESLTPLHGARITGFESPKEGNYRLTYEIRGRKSFVDYTLTADDVTFHFIDDSGRTTTETYPRRPRRGGPPGRDDERRPLTPLMQALDADHDGALSGAEIAAAPRVILTLDRNHDGQITADELRPEPQVDRHPPGERQPRGNRDNPAPPRGGAARSPQGQGGDAADANRRPWIQVHATEMDTNHDGTLTRVELLAETDATFAGYDRDKDGRLARTEYEGSGGVRSAMGGFVKQHAREIDADSDGVITRDELRATATRMFDRADRNQNQRLDASELSAQAPQRPEARTKGQGQRQRPGGGQGQGQRPGGGNARNNGRQTDPNQAPPFHTEVPAHSFDVILGRPTDRAITLSVVSYEDTVGYVTFGPSSSSLTNRTPDVTLPAGKPVPLRIDALAANKEYHYQLHRRNAGVELEPGPVATFRTQRAPGSSFTFTVQADSHLDLGVTPALYERTLGNARADRPDFHFELGDTFMTDKFARYSDAISQYRAQRYYFGRLCDTAPLFFVLGNHDGESGSRGNGTADNITVWSARNRKLFLPNPEPDAFYSGNTDDEPFVGKLGDYYAWEWGNALFIVLDPFWYTTTRRFPENNFWERTLGERQYRWLESTLKSSRKEHKFVFLHHLVGGATREARGGAEAVPFFEWGGHDLDGSDTFARHRPGWGQPIHQLLVAHGVSAVFHGHDHFYAHQERDGVIYQLVPQPGNARYTLPRTAEEYGYHQGTLRNGPGHLRVKVTPAAATVDYVLSVLPREEQPDRKNGQVVTSYTIPARERTSPRHP